MLDQVREEEEDLMSDKDQHTLNIEMESELAVLFGMEYTDFKQFHSLHIDTQQAKIDQFHAIYQQLESIIDLNNYNLTGRGLISILESLEDTPNLTHLYLSNNSLTVITNQDFSICKLCNSLENSRQTKLSIIDISNNEKLADRSGEALCALILRMKNIRSIQCDGTGISDSLRQRIAKLCNNNSQI